MNYRKESSGIAALCRKFLCVALMAVVSVAAYAQGKTVSGKVIDESGEPMIGVTVMVKGTSNGTSTDLDGAFAVRNVADNATLVFSYVGCVSQEVKVAGKSTINVTLREDSNVLDDLVVVGYGTQKKSDVTGAVSHIGADELQTRRSTMLSKRSRVRLRCRHYFFRPSRYYRYYPNPRRTLARRFQRTSLCGRRCAFDVGSVLRLSTLAILSRSTSSRMLPLLLSMVRAVPTV